MTVDCIQRVRERPHDQRRWADWYKKMYPKLYYIAYRFSKGRREVAQDLVAESFERFLTYQAIDRIESDAHAFAFLVTTCRNIAINRADDNNERLTESLPDDVDLVANLTEPLSETYLDINRIINALDPADKALVELAHEGIPLGEIARKLGVSYTAAGVRLHRLRKRLRAAYGPA